MTEGLSAVRTVDLSLRRPALLRTGEVLQIRATNPRTWRVPCQFVSDLNEGTLRDRGAPFFRAAAQENRLFEVAKADHRLVAVGAFDNQEDGSELTSLVCHPATRGLGIATLLAQVMVAFQVGSRWPDTPHVKCYAYVLDGNEGPRKPLLRSGFHDDGPIEVDPSRFDGAMDHMARSRPDGSKVVCGRRYSYSQDATNRLLYELWQFRKNRGVLTREDSGLVVRVDFEDLIPAEYLDAHIEWLRTNGQ